MPALCQQQQWQIFQGHSPTAGIVETDTCADNLDGRIFVLLPCPVIAAFQSAEGAVFNNHPFRDDEVQRRLEGTVRQGLLIEKTLQTLQIGPFLLSFADDDVAGTRHDLGQSAGWGMPE